MSAFLSEAMEVRSEGDEDRAARLRAQAREKLDALRDRSPYYRKTWYVKRACGLRAWQRFEAISAEHRAHSAEGIGAAREAAKWYSQAIRARPRLGVMHYVGLPFWRRYRLRSRRSPILDANAFDAHFYAAHPIRAGYYEWRFQRRRRALLRGPYRDLRRGYLDLAEVQLDWLEVGRHRPGLDRYDAVEAAALAARDRVRTLLQASAEEHAGDITNGKAQEPT